MKQSYFIGALAIAATVLFTGCSTTGDSIKSVNSLTPAKVETMSVGKTKKVDVIKSLGGPNMVFKEGKSKEVWTYDQIRVEKSQNGYDISAFLLGQDPTGPATVLGGGRAGFSNKKDVSSVKTMTVIIEFGSNGLVSDYQMLSTSF